MYLPFAYSPFGLSGQDLERCPVSPQIKHLANGNSPVKLMEFIFTNFKKLFEQCTETENLTADK